jgi:hypothetical protein
VKKLGWKHSFSEIMVALGRARRRDVSNNILQQSLVELRRTRQVSPDRASPQEITSIDETSHRPGTPPAPEAR